MYEKRERFSSLSGVDIQDEVERCKRKIHSIVWDIVMLIFCLHIPEFG